MVEIHTCEFAINTRPPEITRKQQEGECKIEDLGPMCADECNVDLSGDTETSKYCARRH